MSYAQQVHLEGTVEADKMLNNIFLDQFEISPNELSEDLDDLWREIDGALEGDVVFSADLGSADGSDVYDMHALFLEMVRQTLGPLCRYMRAVVSGENAREVLELSEITVTAVLPKVEQVGLVEHHEDLAFFRSLLLLALGETDQHAVDKMKEVVVEGFEQIKSRYSLRFRGNRVAMANLVSFYRALRRNDDISHEDVRRLFAVGIPSVTWVRKTKVNELQTLCGLSDDVLREIRRISFVYHIENSVGATAITGRRYRAARAQRREDSLVLEDLGLAEQQANAIIGQA